jgi:hypothetical protein
MNLKKVGHVCEMTYMIIVLYTICSVSSASAPPHSLSGFLPSPPYPSLSLSLPLPPSPSLSLPLPLSPSLSLSLPPSPSLSLPLGLSPSPPLFLQTGPDVCDTAHEKIKKLRVNIQEITQSGRNVCDNAHHDNSQDQKRCPHDFLQNVQTQRSPKP